MVTFYFFFFFLFVFVFLFRPTIQHSHMIQTQTVWSAILLLCQLKPSSVVLHIHATQTTTSSTNVSICSVQTRFSKTSRLKHQAIDYWSTESCSSISVSPPSSRTCPTTTQLKRWSTLRWISLSCLAPQASRWIQSTRSPSKTANRWICWSPTSLNSVKNSQWDWLNVFTLILRWAST